MKLDHEAQIGNEIAVKICSDLFDKYGVTTEYECVVGSIATTMLFHIFRLRLLKSKKHSIEVLRHVLGDVSDNIKKTSGHDIVFTVE